MFGAVLALMAIFVTCLISGSKYKSLSVKNQRNNKEQTLVKIGNSSTTYNRSSTSSLTNNNNNNNINSNLLNSNLLASTADLDDFSENQKLLLDDQREHTNVLLLSSSSSSSSNVSPLGATSSTLTGVQLLPNLNSNQDQVIAQNSLNNHLSSIFYSNSHGLHGNHLNEGKNFFFF